MLNGISSGASNQVHAFTAANAFRVAQQALEQGQKQQQQDNTPSGVDLKDNDVILRHQNINEIKDIAKSVGETNLSDEDIKYGLTYGRSVIADFSV